MSFAKKILVFFEEEHFVMPKTSARVIHYLNYNIDLVFSITCFQT